MTYGLFEAIGVELEYMIVDAQTLDVRPIADTLIHDACGQFANDFVAGPVTWSNELARHVIELKTTLPAPSCQGLHEGFHIQVCQINERLKPRGAMLLPTAMHPSMVPARDFQVWPHGCNETYEAFNRIFDCRGHGWSNLQSMHINLPFANDQQFASLHEAIRFILPIIPALCASSPYVERVATGLMDNRLEAYRCNSTRIPELAGDIIPESVSGQREYETSVLQPMYRAIAAHDPDGTLQHEWLNARGAIARFERNTIEIRVLDIQECPRADLAIAELIVSLVKHLIGNNPSIAAGQHAFPTARLKEVFLATIRDADQAVIDDDQYLQLLGLAPTPLSAGQLWQSLLDTIAPQSAWDADTEQTIRQIVQRGCLSRQILAHSDPASGQLASTYHQLAANLQNNTLFDTTATDVPVKHEV